MMENKESDDNIQFVVDDFKQKYQNEQLKPLPEPAKTALDSGPLSTASGLFKSTGKLVGGAILNTTNLVASKTKDVSRMESSGNAQETIDQQAIQKARILAQQGKKTEADRLLEVVRSHGKSITLNDILPDSQQNNVEQIAGAGLGTAAELGAFTTGGGGATAAKNVVSSGAKTFGKGAAKGAISGAVNGGAYGALQGVGQAMQDNMGTEDVLAEGLRGGASGAFVGGALGVAAGGVSGALAGRAERNISKVSREAYDVVRPELTKAEKISALNEGRGVVRESGEIVINPTRRDLQVAKVSENIVSSKKTSVENIASLKSELGKEAESTKQGLKEHNSIFNKNQLSSKLRSLEKPPLLVSDDRLNNAYELAQKKFVEIVDKHPKNLAGLLDARKEFDMWAEKGFPHIFDDQTQAPLQQALRDMRTAANDFITEKLPQGSPFKASLKKQNLLYEAMDNIANKSYKDVGTNRLQRFIKNKPKTAKVLEAGAKLVGGATIGGAGFEIGKSLMD